jgi:hypothetical protein
VSKVAQSADLGMFERRRAQKVPLCPFEASNWAILSNYFFENSIFKPAMCYGGGKDWLTGQRWNSCKGLEKNVQPGRIWGEPVPKAFGSYYTVVHWWILHGIELHISATLCRPKMPRSYGPWCFVVLKLVSVNQKDSKLWFCTINHFLLINPLVLAFYSSIE